MRYLINTPSPQRWTDTAIMCYERRCVCKGCALKEVFKDNAYYKECYMKNSVLALFAKLGKPSEAETFRAVEKRRLKNE